MLANVPTLCEEDARRRAQSDAGESAALAGKGEVCHDDGDSLRAPRCFYVSTDATAVPAAALLTCAAGRGYHGVVGKS